MNEVYTAPWCSAPLCTLARAQVPPGVEDACALAFAIAVRAGQEIARDEPAVCADCGIPRWIVPQETWLRSWTGEPLCAECRADLELDGELRGFAAFAAELPEHEIRRTEEVR